MSVSSIPQISGLPSLLAGLRRRVWLSSTVRGLAEVLALVVAALLLALCLDFLIPLPASMRLGLLIAVLAVAVGSVWSRVVHPLLAQLPDEELAAAVDLTFPELHESLATLVSLTPGRESSGDAGSPAMRRHLAASVAGRLSELAAEAVVSPRPVLRRLGMAAGVVCLALIPMLMWPQASRQLLQRLITPFANTGTVRNLDFEVPQGDRTVAIGSDVHFVAIPRWRLAEGTLPERVVIRLETAGGQYDELPARYDEVQEQYIAVLPDVQQSFRYRVEGGGTHTRWFQIVAAEAPVVSLASLRFTPPAYTGRPIEIIDGVVGEITVFERSQLEITVAFSQPVHDVVLEWKDWQPVSSEVAVDEFPAAASGEPSDQPEEVRQLQPTRMTPDGRTAMFEFDALGGGRFEFRGTNDSGLTNGAEPERVLLVEEDAAPELTATGIQNGTPLRPDDILPVNCVVTDDIGVDALELYYRRNDEAERIEPAAGFERGARHVDYSFRLPLASLQLKDGDTFSVRVRAADERPVPEPHVVWSDQWTIQIDDQAEAIGQQPLSAENQAMIDALKELERQLQQDALEARQLKNRVWQQWDEAAKETVERLSEKEQQQGRQLTEISEQAAQHPLMQKPSTQLQNLGTHLRNEVPKPLQAARDAERNVASDQLQQAVNELDQAAATLRQTIEQMETIARIEQELTELNRLALDAEQLADSSAKLKEEQSSGQPEAGQSDEEFQEALRQQEAALEADRQRLQQELDDLLQRQQELLEAARRSQQEQLSEISEAARQLARLERDVSEGIEDEARDVSRENRTLADRLQQLKQEIQNLGGEIGQKAPGVSPPDAQPLDEALRELRRGNLGQPREHIQDVRDSVESSAEQLRQPAAADTSEEQRENRESLAQRAGELSRELSDIQTQLDQDAAERAPSAPADTPDTGNAEPQRSVAEELIERIQQLANSSRELADSVQEERGQPATGPAREMARRASEAADSARAGQFSRAADRMRNASAAAAEASANDNNPAQPERPGQLQSLADEFSRLADTVQQLQEDRAARVAAQENSQRDIAEQSAELPQQLADIAERMMLPALGLEPQGRLAEEAQAAAQQASQSGQQASQQLNEQQFHQAAESGRQTTGELNRVAQLAQQAGQTPSNGEPLIPSEVGQNVTEAMQSLDRAGEMLGEPGDSSSGQQGDAQGQAATPGESPSGSGQNAGSQPGPGQEGPGQAGTQPGSGGAGEAGESSGSSTSGQPGSGKSGGQPSSSKQLSDAARALADAARNSLPQQFNPGELSDGGESQGNSAMGNDAEFDGRDVARSGSSSRIRNWGALQDELDGEMKNSAGELIDSEYSGLIQRYRRELAKAVAGASAKAAGGGNR